MRRKVILVIGACVWTPILLLLGWGFIYQPLKFRYVIWRVESAATESEEAKAFDLARRSGRVFEIDSLKQNELPARAQHLRGGPIIKIEWLESSFWTGTPYRAYRRVLSTNNLQLLHLR
ncbi:MAG TPA: hypothetical protein VM680_10700 [Verrucomicrobiae bacterium]|nr:hypothetical protein [Verrucomicrobiae bacterium]